MLQPGESMPVTFTFRARDDSGDSDHPVHALVRNITHGEVAIACVSIYVAKARTQDPMLFRCTGRGGVARLFIAPEHKHVFGIVQVGTEQILDLTIGNNGNATLSYEVSFTRVGVAVQDSDDDGTRDAPGRESFYVQTAEAPAVRQSHEDGEAVPTLRSRRLSSASNSVASRPRPVTTGTLDAGESTVLHVAFRPSRAVDFGALFTIATNAG